MRARSLGIRRVLAALAAVGAVAMTASSASAYSLLGGKWPNQPGPGVCCLSLNYLINTAFSKDGQAWSDGAGAWYNSPALYILSNVQGVPGAQSQIAMGDTNNSSVGWDGLTVLDPCSGAGCQYTAASVLLNYYYTQNYSAAKAQSVSAHELGHVAGLAHVSSCVLMNPYTSTRWSASCGWINTPEQDDINGVDAQY